MSGLSSKALLAMQASLNKAVQWAKQLEAGNEAFEARVKAMEAKFASLAGRFSWVK